MKESFKIGKFTCKRKYLTPSELEFLLAKTEQDQKLLQELPKKDQEKKKGLAEKLKSKIESLKKDNYQE